MNTSPWFDPLLPAAQLAAPSILVPQNLVATATSSSEISLTWDVFAGATAYDIERDSTVIVFDHSTNSYADSGLTAATEYTYRVRAVL